MLNIREFQPVKIYRNVSYFAPYLAPKGASPFICTNLNPHSQSCFPPIGLVVLEK